MTAGATAAPGTTRGPVSARLPVFPWDRILPYKRQALAHPDGIADLSVGTPVDPVPAVVRAALDGASDSPGYPAVQGTATVREAAVEWLGRTLGVRGLDPAAVLPTIGSKELVAGLPGLLGIGPGDVVVVPELAYPTYDLGARIAGADVVAADDVTALDPARVRLVWLNSPGNPTGVIRPASYLAETAAWCRAHDVVLASDECYATLGWDATPVSVLDPAVAGDDHAGLLAVHSLSKRSNLAGYRAGFVAGDPALVAELLAVRRHTGMMLPGPVQAAMAAALADDDHADAQREVYATRRTALRTAVEAAGFTVSHSEGGLYLWATRDEPCLDTVAWLAERGILVAPGDFYGAPGDRHVRIALTATDERIAAACARLAAS